LKKPFQVVIDLYNSITDLKDETLKAGLLPWLISCPRWQALEEILFASKRPPVSHAINDWSAFVTNLEERERSAPQK
jgi:hypothetical protein